MSPLPLPAIQPLETRTLLAAPLGRNDQFSLLHDRTFVAPVSLLANDTSLTGSPLTAQLVDSPTLGSLVLLADGRFTYTPAAGYTGTLQFTYQPFDGLALGNLTTVSLTVGNTLPLARADSYTCTTDRFDTASAGAFSLLANDWDRDGDTLQPVITALPAWGTLSLTSGGHFLYIPQPNRFGVDSFRYRAHDGVGESDEVEVAINVVSPFAASLNLADVPLAPGLSQGHYAVTPLTGAVQFSHSVGPLTLRYDSVEANPRPLVSLETRYGLFRTPDRLEAQFTFNGTAQPSVWFNTSQLFAQTPLRFSFQAQSGLATGMYAWSIRLIAHFGSQTATREFTGVTPVVNRSASTFGSGWSLASIDHLVTIPAGATPAGQLLVLGSGGALFFEATGPTTFASPAGPLAFSTLAKLADGSFVLTAPTGETTAFDRFGQLASRTDLNGNKTTYTYYYGPNYGTKPNPPAQLKFITDPFGRVVTLTYGMNGLYSALQIYDPSRVHTPQYDTAGQLTSLTSPDPDGATGPLPAAVVQYEYDTSRRVIHQALPENRTTLFSYDDAGRIQTVTQSDLSLRRFQPQQTLGWVNPTGGLGSSDRPAPLYRDGVPMGFQVNELGQQTRWRTDRFGFLIRQQTSLGTVTLIERDANGLPTRQIAPDPDDAGPLSSPETRWRYDARGNLVELVQPDGAVQQWAYHATLNRPTEWTDAKGAAWRSSYDTRGNQLTTTNPLGAVTTFTYTTRGQVASIRQPDPLTGAAGTGPLTSFSWSTTNGQLATLTNPDLSKQTFTTNLWGEQLTATDELARKVTSTRDALGRLLTLTRPDPDGTGPLLAPVIRLAWDTANRLISQTDPLGQVTQYRYHSRDWVEEVIAPDPDGPTGPQSSPVTTNTYNAAGWLIAQIDPLHAVTQFAYDADGVLTQRTLPDLDGTGPRPAPVEMFVRDRLGRVVEQRDPLNRVTQFEYDPVGRVVRSTSPLGAETRWQYDIAGELLSETLPDPDGPGPLASPIHSSTYDSLGRVVSQTNALGNVTQFTYNHLDQLTSATQPDPDGNGPLSAPVWQWAYNTRGWVAAETDPLGFITRHTYDTAGQLKTTTQPDPDDAGPLLAPVTTYTYDPLGRITAVKNPLGFTTSYGYDAADRLLSTKDPRGAITRQGYDNLGRLITLTQPDPDTTGPLVAPVTRWSYDAAGQMVSRVNPLGHVATWQYDPLGRTTAQTDEVGRTMAWEYDVASQLVRQTDPLGNSLLFLYDAEGREVQVTLPDPDPLDALPAPSRQTHYDLLGRVIGQTDERGGLTEFTYDLQDNLRQLTDPAGNSTRFEYDRLDRQIAEVNPLGQSRTWSYNARGNLLAYVDRNGRRTQWAYDPLGRTASEQWLAGESLVYTLQYTYDVGSRVTVAQDPLSRYSYVYNQNDQVTKVTSGNVGAAAVVLDSVYDLLGRRTELKATVAGKADFRNTYQYDALSRMTQVAQQAQVSTNPVQQKRVNYAYTPAGDRRQVTRWADVAGTRGVATSDWVYDAGGRLSELTHRANTAGTVLNAYRWSYDALGRPVSESSSDGVSTWQYDASSQVTAADHTRQASERYTYDATGNRTAATQSSGTANTITTGANNRLLADDRYRYEYDAEGNRTRRTDLATENYQLLTWDHRNRLTAVTSHTATGTKTSQVTYTYDLYDRRISRSVDADGNGTFETVQRFAYDGSDLVLAFSGSTNRLTNRYLHGPAIDEILAEEQLSTTGAATVLWSLADRLGTVRDLVQYNTTTSTTTLVNHIQYDTFGQLTSQTNTSQTPWFGYTGREWDTATGLTYYRARWYDPRAGRFISEDPLSFAAGDVNLNRYVGNGATLWVDPSGMDAAPSEPTENTYRKRFIQLTPAIDNLKTPFHIHHTLEQDKIIAARFLKERGINVHTDQHLRGVDIKLHDVISAQQKRFWKEQREIMVKQLNRDRLTISETKQLIDLDLLTKHSQALTAAFEDCLIKSGDDSRAISKALKNSSKVMNDAESLAKKLSSFYKDIQWTKLMTAAQLLILAQALASSGQAIANPTPEQQQYRDHFYARFELSLNFAFDNHYLTGEHINHLRDAMLNYTRSIGVSDKIQASLDLKLSLVEVQSP